MLKFNLKQQVKFLVNLNYLQIMKSCNFSSFLESLQCNCIFHYIFNRHWPGGTDNTCTCEAPDYFTLTLSLKVALKFAKYILILKSSHFLN